MKIKLPPTLSLLLQSCTPAKREQRSCVARLTEVTAHAVGYQKRLLCASQHSTSLHFLAAIWLILLVPNTEECARVISAIPVESTCCTARKMACTEISTRFCFCKQLSSAVWQNCYDQWAFMERRIHVLPRKGRKIHLRQHQLRTHHFPSCGCRMHPCP